MKEFNIGLIKNIQENLNNHGVYRKISNMNSLKVFMEHHVFSVWDFMSLVKFLQNAIAPSQSPWRITASRNSRRFINSIILEEESDIGLPDQNGNTTYASHFEMYCEAMEEVGADSSLAIKFSRSVPEYGLEASTDLLHIPQASRMFMKETMDFIKTGKPHVVAAAFALGREKIIPDMFRKLLKEMNLSSGDAPAFHYYLERHIHLDEDFHAPLSLQMLNELCGSDDVKIREAEEAAIRAIEARIRFWDGVESAIEGIRARVA